MKAGLLETLFLYGAFLVAGPVGDRYVVAKLRGKSILNWELARNFVGMGLLVMVATGIAWVIAVFK